MFAESENQQEIVITEEAEATEEIQESVQETPEPGSGQIREEGEKDTASEEKESLEQETSDTDQVVIYHTNDIHGAFEASEGGSVGVAKAATLKKETENALLVDAGDATQGLPLVSLNKGSSAIDLMNVADYDLMTTGNHEYDYGLDQLFANAAKAQFPILAANVYRDGSPVMNGKTAAENNGENAVLTVGDKKIGFFGLLTQDTKTSTSPDAVSQLEFKDEVETAKQQIDFLEAQDVDAIVAVCHLGDQGVVDCTSRQLAEALTGAYQDKLDVIIDGHSHTLENTEENGVLIVQTGTGLTQLGKVTLTFDEEEEPEAAGELLDEADLASVTPDAGVTTQIAEIQSGQEALLNEKVARTDTVLWGGTINNIAEARVYETNLGDLTADAFVHTAQDYLEKSGQVTEVSYVFGAVNGGGLRASIPKGDITMGDLVTIFPFSNTLMVKKVTPSLLYQVLENSVSAQTGQSGENGMLEGSASGGYLQISGFEFSYDPTAAPGQKVTSIRVPGEAVGTYTELSRDDVKTQIALVSNSYIMSGGNEYAMLAELPLMAEIGGELEAVQKYLQSTYASMPVDNYPVQGGRIHIANENAPETYEARIQILDEQGNPAANQAMSYYVDSDSGQNGTADENGILTITVKKGPHAVKLSVNQQEIYINNYTGNGIRTDITSLPSLVYSDDGSCDPFEWHSITYELNGGTNHKDNPDGFEENQGAVRLKDPTRDGYLFEGWYRDADFQEAWDEIPAGTKEDVTVYAKWKKDGLEPNDSWKEAVKLRVPSRTESYLSTAEDVDYYRFTLTKEDRISIRLTQPGEDGVYYDAVLYDQDHNVIRKSQMSYDQSLVQTLDKGTYYIKIAALNGESSREAYVLRLSRIAVAGMDLSEQNMLTRSLHPDSPTAYDLGMGLNSGGNYIMATAYLSNWEGPLLETQDPYPEYTITGVSESGYQFDPSEEETKIVTDESPVYHLQNAIWLPDRADPLDNDHIKSAIYTYGGVDAYYMDASAFRNEETASIYVPELSDEESAKYGAGGHCITLVGWDDNYPKENFGPVTPPGDGAFLFKNSWGEEWGMDGYYYLSYYSCDLLINPGALYFLEEGTDNYNTIYQYDPFGCVGMLSAEGDGYAANLFTADSQEELRAVSFTVVDENTDYEIYVQTKDGLQQVASGSVRYGGYKTVRLQNAIALDAGEEFKVIVHYSREDGTVRIPVEYPMDHFSSKADSREGISFISADGENWEDLYQYKANPCIKAFTYDASVTGQAQGVDDAVNRNKSGRSGGVSSGTIDGFVLQGPENVSGETVNRTKDGNALGARAAGLPNEVSSEEAPIANLPSKYDLRDIGAVTPVRNQYDMGSCWTFAAMGSAESILQRNENASYSYPMNLEIQGEKTIELSEDVPQVLYEAAASLSTDMAATDVIIWELTGDLDSVELAEGPIRSASGEKIPLFTAKKAGTITLTAVSAADETRSDTIMITIRDAREEDKPIPTGEPSATPTKNPDRKPTATVSAVKKPARPTSAASSKKKSDTAKTADNTPLEQWIILTAAGAGAIAAALARKRMRK